ncbi:MAG: ABC transporter permease [Bacteroidetes bacterium]|nr:ABC transporter permease [Bacteroidota bacterium]
MFYHNLKLAFRNLVKHKTFSFINIAGLSIGLASCIIIGLYAYQELSFDRFHSNHKNIYRINKSTNEKEKHAQLDGITPGQLGPALTKEIPEVAQATRFRPWFSDILVSHDTAKSKLKGVAFTDPSFLQIFDFPLMKGNRESALSEPFSAVITESTAKKYFGDADPVGKTLNTVNNIPVTVTAVAKDVPDNSSIHFNMLISWSTLTVPANANQFSWMNSWSTQISFTFVQLKNGSDANNTGAKISKLLHAHFPEKEFQYRCYLQPLDQIHLGSSDIQFAKDFQTNSGKIVYTLLVIAAFIILIACFNFINLTTAGALGRAKETGVQKVLGATKLQLVRKFFSESLLLCAFSLSLAIVIVAMVLPLFNELANSSLSISILFQSKIILALFGLLILVGLISGIYPALFLSRFKSTDVFRNVIKAGKDNWLRKSLVTTQFALSVLLIFATVVVNNQMQFLSKKDLGFDKAQMLVLPLSDTHVAERSKEFVNILKQNPGIVSVTATNNIPGQGFNGYGIIPEGYRAEDLLVANVLETDADFLSTYNIKLANGRYFSSQLATDTSSSIVINEAMAKYIGWKDPVGKQFEIYQEMKGKVIGVMNDFNFASLHEKIQPLAVMLRNNPGYLSIKLKPGTTQSSLDFIQNQWKQFDKEYPFDFFFMDEKMNQYYESDQKLLRVLSLFALLAIAIACIGLFGLTIYSTRQRVKEISIRKILGAPVAGIVALLSKDFLKLVMIASLISFPIAWWAMNKWLEDFAYRIHIDWSVFALAGISVLLIALFTVSFQALKAAIAKPVKSLRTE